MVIAERLKLELPLWLRFVEEKRMLACFVAVAVAMDDEVDDGGH